MANVVASIGFYSVALMTNVVARCIGVSLMTNVVALIGLYMVSVMTNLLVALLSQRCINDKCCCTYRVV